MLAVLAALAFALGLVFNIVGHGTRFLVWDMLLGGLFLLTLHFIADGWPAWPRSRPQA